MRAPLAAVTIVAALAAASTARAAPRCRLTTPAADPCLRVTGSPWLDEGATPAAFAPAPDDAAPDRRALSLGVVGGIYVAFSTWAYFAWYYDKAELPAFTVGGDGYFGERTYAGGADKLGHAWANYALGRATAEVLTWGGWGRRPAGLLGAGLTWALFAFVEVKDGYYYQLSPGDLVGNTMGAAFAALAVAVPEVDRALELKVEYWPSAEYLREFRDGNVNVAEDYSGQTYFLGYHLAALPGPLAPPRAIAPFVELVDVGIGFGTRNYKPDPAEGEPRGTRVQELFIGATIDLQRVIDRGLRGRRGGARAVRQTAHALLEVFVPPFLLLPAGGVERSPDR